MKSFLNSPALAFFLVPWVFIIFACSPKLEDLVKSYEHAHNEHDVEKVMSLYASDIRFEIVGSWTKVGKEQVRELADWDAATNSHMIISDIEIIGDTARFKLKEGNDWFRLAGIEFMYYEHCSMVFHEGMLKELKAEFSQESLISFQEVWPPLMQWLSKERSEELLELMPEGEFVYGAESAVKWLALLREWEEIKNGLILQDQEN